MSIFNAIDWELLKLVTAASCSVEAVSWFDYYGPVSVNPQMMYHMQSMRFWQVINTYTLDYDS